MRNSNQMLFKDLGDFFSDFVLELKYREIKHPLSSLSGELISHKYFQH